MTCRAAPDGFTVDQWETFNRDGIIFIENALINQEIDDYLSAINDLTDQSGRYKEGNFLGHDNIVEKSPLFANLIDPPRHIGYAYDLFGELLKLHQSQVFIRPPGGSNYNIWHPDGARALLDSVFSPQLPLHIKIGYRLTDLPEDRMGNLVVLPGSRWKQYMDGYDTHQPIDGQLVVCVPKGTMTIMHSSLWHRVEPNESSVTRRNIFVAYCPSWVTPADRLTSAPDWLTTLNREQRIIMRSYSRAYHNAKPPANDFPLFLDRQTGQDRNEDYYRDHVKLERRKRHIFAVQHATS